MQCIFMLDFSIMESLITLILDTLRSQEVYLWIRKPFQMQWLKLLQTYIENIYAQTDRLSSDLQTKESMIQVLVTELILSKHTNQNFFDTSLNQALLYRLVSIITRRTARGPASNISMRWGIGRSRCWQDRTVLSRPNSG